jgi:hypothetical protein
MTTPKDGYAERYGDFSKCRQDRRERLRWLPLCINLLLLLRTIGHVRRIAVTLLHWANAPRLIQGMDLILTVARVSMSL